MTAATILDELRARGAQVERHGDRLRIAPAHVISRDLFDAVRRHKQELLPLVSIVGATGETRPPRIVDVGDESEIWLHRIIVDEYRRPLGPVRLNGWTVITDAARAV